MTTEAKINQAFAKCGWTVDPDMVVQRPTKVYQTATAPHECVVYLLHVESENSIKVTGEYTSQGHNVLSTCWVYVPQGSSEGDISERVDQFIAKAEKEIDLSYARRLYLKTPRGQEVA